MSRSFYSDNISDFKLRSIKEILGELQTNSSLDIAKLQSNAWISQIKILKDQLKTLNSGRILFEYTIPRMGKRVDNVLLYKNIIFVLEFKCGEKEYTQHAIDQVYDYALDLKDFHKESDKKLIVPILVATEAKPYTNTITEIDRIIEPLKANKDNLYSIIESVCAKYDKESSFDYNQWENSEYFPTPTIVEAAQALYNGHNVTEITRSDANHENLSTTTNSIDEIIKKSKENHKKSICFVTGVPGAGKTLVGLNLAIKYQNANNGERAVFLSGNYPLVTVLQEALARDKVLQEKNNGNKINKKDATRVTSEFIQIIHKYRDSFVNNEEIPPERVAIFDEAQRAWTKEQICKFMSQKKGINDFNYSEPEFLISTMDRHKDWAVIVCLVGGGQEINTGEAGLPEWFESLKRSFKDWDVYITNELNDNEYLRGATWEEMISGLNCKVIDNLHLRTSVRSFRTPDLANLVKSILDNDKDASIKCFNLLKDKYPIAITRDLSEAKKWVKSHSKGTERYGLIASSGGLRLKPSGIFVKNSIGVPNWFLNTKEDIRSSYGLEDTVTEFDIQGLEIDYTIVAWDGDFRYFNGDWTYNNFSGKSWNKVNSEDNRIYLKNAYRVLLTRARQGMVIFIPKGSDEDITRKHEYYDGTYNFLKEIGFEEI